MNLLRQPLRQLQGISNPVVATFELIVAIVLSLLALTLPVVAGIVVVV